MKVGLKKSVPHDKCEICDKNPENKVKFMKN